MFIGTAISMRGLILFSLSLLSIVILIDYFSYFILKFLSQTYLLVRFFKFKKTIDSFHRCGRPLVGCCEPAGKLWQPCKVLYVFEHKQYLLIHAPYTPIVVFWHISQNSFNTVTFVKQQYLWNIAIQLAFSCYSSWANLRCSGCSPLEVISLWNGTINHFVHF